MPLLPGAGIRLFENTGRVGLEVISVIQAGDITTLCDRVAGR